MWEPLIPQAASCHIVKGQFREFHANQFGAHIFHWQLGSRNLFRGTMLVTGACLLWTLLLYMPYAYYMASFTYANGDEPGWDQREEK